jgi:predicted dehydrogenase
MPVIRVGLLGYGYWGPNLARCFSESEKAYLQAVHDPDPGALQRAARRFPHARMVNDARDIIAAPDIDAVAIATPVATHYDLALAALRADKQVWVEKPIACTSDEARHLIEEADRRRLVLMVDHTFVYTGAVRKIRDLLAAGELGEIYYYDSTRVNLGLLQHDVNVVWDLAVHDLSILDFAFAEAPLGVSATAVSHVPGSPETMAFINLFYPGGALAHINVNWLAPVKVRQTMIGGSRKMIVWDDLQPSEKVKIFDKGVTVMPRGQELYELLIGYRSGDMWAPQLPTAEALRTEVDHFIDCIETNATPITDGQMGLRVVELLEAATWSIGQRGRTIDLKLERKAS